MQVYTVIQDIADLAYLSAGVVLQSRNINLLCLPLCWCSTSEQKYQSTVLTHLLV